MSRLVIRAALFTVVFVALLVLVRTVGGQAKNPLANWFSETTLPDGQTQVCWHHICPGLTTVDEAKAILNGNATFRFNERAANGSLCWYGIQKLSGVCLDKNDQQIRELRLTLNPWIGEQIRLGDVITLWGAPEKASIGPFCADSYNVFRNNVTVYTTNLSLWVDVAHEEIVASQLVPYSQIDNLEIYAPSVALNVPIHSVLTSWHGFVSLVGPQVTCGG